MSGPTWPHCTRTAPAPALLYRMAQEYFRSLFNVDDGPKAIEELLQGDRDLIDATLQGLRGAIDREDVPDIDKILSLREKGHMHYLGLAFPGGPGGNRKNCAGRLIPMGRWPDSQGDRVLLLYAPRGLSASMVSATP